MVNQETPTIVFDIGARYGPHPSFNGFHAPVQYVLVEADPSEADRLTALFTTPVISVVNAAVVPRPMTENLTLRLTQNAAMSSLFPRTDISPLYTEGSLRADQPATAQEVQVTATTIDELTNKFNRPHFIKIDTEGGEFAILEASSALSKVIGVRSEVTFTEVFSDGTGPSGSFSAIHDLLVSSGFSLLNLDYARKGDYFSKFVSSNSGYGQLQSTDGVWIRPIAPMLTDDSSLVDGLRGIAYALHNGAPDFALSLLSEHNLYQKGTQAAPKLWNHLAICVAKHLYSLKWEPAQSIAEHEAFWEGVFHRDYPRAHQFNNNLELNPAISNWNGRLE